MANKAISDFIVVTKESLNAVRRDMFWKKGRILIAERGYNQADAHLYLYDRPVIGKDSISTYRGEKTINGVSWQTNWENDRWYTLRPVPELSADSLTNSCRELFEGLAVGRYEFSIGFHSTVYRGLFADKGVTLYIPKKNSLRLAFQCGLKHVINLISKDYKKKDRITALLGEISVENIVDYMLNDLSNSNVFNKNVAAGMEADMLTM
ncbi:MAG: hypothetical protein AAB587_00365 [Patescibacteria group bacterium]